MSTASDPWGRVDEDGTVFVRTAEGGLSPKVLAVELSGVSLRDGRATFEVIVPQQGGDELGER